eukprot:gb/GECG01010107.1/.p1 GENE.gb/GECG01010107.1/~~gb/GECG01010107.1/.p1  ORF type:complete len:1612 (+),score=179.60 gb/GECG01010107.1/:1-4836(+)
MVLSRTIPYHSFSAFLLDAPHFVTAVYHRYNMDYLLELTEKAALPADQNNGKNSYIAVPEGATLRVRVPNSMYMHRKWNYGENLTAFCNIVDKEKCSEFDRDLFFQVESINRACNVTQDWEACILASMAGAFEVILCSVVNDDDDNNEFSSSAYRLHSCINFIVEPALSTERADGTQVEFSLTSLRIQTLLTPNVGPISNWKSTFANTIKGGFNAIHLSPVQRLGHSRSAYSIQDHLSLSESLAAKDSSSTEEERFIALKKAIRSFKQENGIVFFVDVVLNHLSADSPWLLEHPEIGYSVSNSPWLRPAVELDDSIITATSDFLSNRDEEFVISNVEELTEVYNFWERDVLPGIKLWEYYVANSDNHVNRLWQVLRSTNEHLRRRFRALIAEYEGKDIEEMVNLLFHQGILTVFSDGRRFPVDLKKKKLFQYLKENDYLGRSHSEDVSFHSAKQFIDSINLYFYKQYDADIVSAKSAIWNTAKHKWLGERQGKSSLSEDLPLVPLYFARVGVGSTDADNSNAIYDNNRIFACNGFIWDGDSSIDICLPWDTHSKYKQCLHKELNVSSRMVQLGRSVLQGCSEYCRRSLEGLVSTTSRVPASTPYLRRSLVIWGDCVRFRYGYSPEESPKLWSLMTDYVQKMAKVFDGFRIDNAHGQSIHVLRALLDSARRVNPSLHINAELFTGSTEKDIDYIHHLGINSLVREAMQTSSVGELSQAVCQYSERPIGDLVPPFKLLHSSRRKDPRLLTETARKIKSFAEQWGAVHCCSPFTYHTPSMFYDCTHDNEVPAQVGDVANTLSLAVLTSAAGCASGSTKNFDALPLSNVSVVAERRLYHSGEVRSESASRLTNGHEEVSCTSSAFRSLSWGGTAQVIDEPLLLVRRLLNDLKDFSEEQGMCEVHSFRVSGHDDLAVVLRYSPFTGRMLWYIVRFGAFRSQEADMGIKSARFQLEGCVSSLLLVAKLDSLGAESEGKGADSCLSGVAGTLHYWSRPFLESCFMDQEDIDCEAPGVVDWNCSEHKTTMHLDKAFLPPGSVVVLAGSSSAVSWVPYSALSTPDSVSCVPCVLADSIGDIATIFDQLEGEQLHKGVNYLLYTGESEERDSTEGEHGVYNVPSIGHLPWAGVAGLQFFIRQAICTADLDHPVCTHFRDGLWYFEYLRHRISLMKDAVSDLLYNSITKIEKTLEKLPIGLRPRMALQSIYYIFWKGIHASSHHMISHGEYAGLLNFYQSGSSKTVFAPEVSLPISIIGSTNIFYRLAPSNPLLDPRNVGNHQLRQIDPSSICAGIEHFSSGIMRNWGRDTFISLKGIMITNGRYDVAETTLLAYGAVLRHGLIPNLLDSGRRPRYNARDATWFWLMALQQYCRHSPEAYGILQKHVPRLFPSDSQEEYKWHRGKGYHHKTFPNLPTMSVGDIVLEILRKHVSGISFREWDAGPSIDEKMHDEGFQVTAWIDTTTGLLYGGNRWNCGTWMDKMGESKIFNIVGTPATPRDGAAVELNGLLYSTLAWLAETAPSTSETVASKYLDCEKVTLGSRGPTSFEVWKDLVQENFQKLFADQLDVCGLRDVLSPSLQHTSLQLRPNQVSLDRVVTYYTYTDILSLAAHCHCYWRRTVG